MIRYPPDQSAAADLVARWLVSGARLEPTEGAAGIELVTGVDWQGVRDQAAASTSTTTQETLPPPTSTTSTPSPTRDQTTTSLDLASFDC